MIQDNFGLPKEEDRGEEGRVPPEDSWRRVGFFRNASEYWLLVHVLIERVEEQQRERGSGDSRCCERPYTPSRCDEAAMVDLKNLIAEHHRGLGSLGGFGFG